MTTADSTALQSFTGVTQTSFGDRDAARNDQITPYKATENRTDRIAIIDPNFLLVARAHAHFSDDKDKKGLGYVLCRSTFKRQGDNEVPDQVARCCQVLQDAKKRCVTGIIRYTADPKTGKPVKPLDFTMTAWVFGPDKFDNLFNINDEFAERDETGKITVPGLLKVDLIVTCEDESFQRIKIVPSPQCVRAVPEFKANYTEKVEGWMTAMKPRMKKILGRDVTDQELIEKVGDGGGSTVSTPSVKQQAAPSDISDLFTE